MTDVTGLYITELNYIMMWILRDRRDGNKKYHLMRSTGSTGSLEKSVKIGSTGSLRQKTNKNVKTGSTGSEGKKSPSNVKMVSTGSQKKTVQPG